jgi:hypothetical protein
MGKSFARLKQQATTTGSQWYKRGRETGVVVGLTAAMDRYISDLPMPQTPVVAPWAFSIREIMLATGNVPSPLRGTLSFFDRFGSVKLSPEHVGFDGEEIAWSSVTSIRAASLFDAITAMAVQREAERLRHLLPAIPGRKWLILGGLNVLRSLLRRVIWSESLEQSSARVVTEIVYRSHFKSNRRQNPGLAAVLILAAFPAVGQSLITTARLNRVIVEGDLSAPSVQDVHDGRASLERAAIALEDWQAQEERNAEGDSVGGSIDRQDH